MLQTVTTTTPTSRMIEFLELIEVTKRSAAESRLTHYLHHCRRIDYEPPAELLRLAHDQIKRGLADPSQRFRYRTS